MNSTIKTADLSRISQSKLTVDKWEYREFQSEIKKVKYPTHAISNAENVQERLKAFKNEKVKKQLELWLKNLNSYRQVRGDGNCFFRALAFSYIASFPDPTFEKCFSLINQVCLTCCYQKSIPKDFLKFYDHDFLYKVLKNNWQSSYDRAYTSSGKMQLKALLKVFDEFPFIDFIIVLYFRSLCLKALGKFKQQFKQFIDGSEEKQIRTYSEQGEGIIINLCSRMLEIKIYVFEIRKDQAIEYKYVENIDKPIATIYLLYHDNHYDIVEHNDNIEAERSVLKEERDYYGDVNQRLTQGVCIQCGAKGSVYAQSGLCLKCYECSVNNLHNFGKEKYIKGRCAQCGRTKQNISSAYGICMECKQIQNSFEEKRQLDIEKGVKEGRCALCKYPGSIYIETGVCEDCTKYQQRLYESKSNPQIQKGKDAGSSRKQERMSPDQKREAEKVIGKCKKCGFNNKLNADTRLCEQCSVFAAKYVGSIQKTGVECSKCKQKFASNSEFFSKQDSMCKQCLLKSKSYNSVTCKKCNQIILNSKLRQNGCCEKCLPRSVLK